MAGLNIAYTKSVACDYFFRKKFDETKDATAILKLICPRFPLSTHKAGGDELEVQMCTCLPHCANDNLCIQAIL